MNTTILTGHYPKNPDTVTPPETRADRNDRRLIRCGVTSLLVSPAFGVLAHETTSPDWQNVFGALMTIALLPAAVLIFAFLALALDSIGRES